MRAAFALLAAAATDCDSRFSVRTVHGVVAEAGALVGLGLRELAECQSVRP